MGRASEGVIFGHLEKFNDWRSQKKCEKMYFNELQMTEYDARSVPEGEFRDFCQFWPFNWSSKSQSCILKLLGGTKKCPPKWEVGLTKVFVFFRIGQMF